MKNKFVELSKKMKATMGKQNQRRDETLMNYPTPPKENKWQNKHVGKHRDTMVGNDAK